MKTDSPISPAEPAAEAPKRASRIGVARRPIFDRSLGLSAYELVLDSGSRRNGVNSDPSAAMSRLIADIGDAEVAAIVGNQRAWLRCSSAEVLGSLEEALPPARVVVEIEPGVVEGDSRREEIAVLRRRGYTIAAQGHAENAPAALSQLADVATLDLEKLDPHEASSIVARFKQSGVKLAALNVESPERYRTAHELGFDLFRGDFFCKPYAPDDRAPAPGHTTLLRLLAALQDPQIELGQLEELVTHDISLSYSLLRYINSAFFGLRHRVTSIGHAVRLLGLENVKRWSTLMLFAGVDHRPRELMTTALVRARFCELAGPRYELHNTDRLFTLGLMSVIDALMNTSMTRALRPLPLPDETIRALTLRRGPKGKLLNCAIAAERGELSTTVEEPDDAAELAKVYRESVVWAGEAQDAALAQAA
jgi:EAL and modified HD-GYP domain-containing signal transduction protein